MRLQKILVLAGFGSRRKCEILIKKGRVSVNGVVSKIGDSANIDKDLIKVDNKLISIDQKKLYIALNKPKGFLSEVDKNETRPNVRDLVDDERHYFCVGRLDKDSEGLILLTNDGELAHHLTHPRYRHEKEYLVLVGIKPDVAQISAWQKGGIEIEDGFKTAPAKVSIDSIKGSTAWLRIILREGRKRQIRRVGAKLGIPIIRILRIRIGPLKLNNLGVGKWRYLSSKEIKQLKSYIQ